MPTLDIRRVQVPANNAAHAFWDVYDSPNRETYPAGSTNGDKHSTPRFESGGLYASTKKAYIRKRWRFVSGSPGRFFNLHNHPADSPGGYTQRGVDDTYGSGVSSIAFDYKQGYTDSDGETGARLTLQAQERGAYAGSPYANRKSWSILSQAEVTALQNASEWITICMEITFGLANSTPQGAVKLWVNDEIAPRIDIVGVNTCWLYQGMYTVWEGCYDNLAFASPVTIDHVPYQIGRSVAECLADAPTRYTSWSATQTGVGGNGTGATTGSVNSTTLFVPTDWGGAGGGGETDADPNDDLADAIDISGTLFTSHSGSTIGATEEADEMAVLGFCGPDVASVWYKFQAPYTGTISFDASTPTSGFWPWFQLFTATNSTPDYPDLGDPFAGAATAQWGNSTASDAPALWPIISGDWYVLYAGSYDCPPDNTEGAFTFQFSQVTAPANNSVADAELIDASTSVFGTTAGAEMINGFYMNWYKLVVPEAGTIRLTICNTDADVETRVDSFQVFPSGGTSAASFADLFQGFPGFAEASNPSCDDSGEITAYDLDPGSTAPYPGAVFYLAVSSYSPATSAPRAGAYMLGVGYADAAPPPSSPSGGGSGSALAPGGPSAVVPSISTWRWLIADLDGSTITLLDKHARERSIDFRLNTPMQISGTISSDDTEINMLHTDGFPILTEGDRLLYCFRRDFNGNFNNDPWYIRAAGVILQLQDNALSGSANTTFTAFDPWQVLYSRPVWNPNVDSADQGLYDTTYEVTPINEIIVDLLDNMAFNVGPGGPPTAAFAYLDWGQTPDWDGTIETLPAITHTFQKEMSIGEALDQLCARGNVDIVITPIFDPVYRPGYIGEMSIYGIAGSERDEAIFAWDKPSRSTVAINRSIDGTQRSNNIRFHVGQGGDVTSLKTSPVSVARFGEYWSTQFFVAAEHEETIADFAEEQIDLYAEHLKTVSIEVAPERCPDPFLEWYLGDTVRVFASNKFRATQSGFQRVIAFTLNISDTALETVNNLEIMIPHEITETFDFYAPTIAASRVTSRYRPPRTQSKLRPPGT